MVVLMEVSSISTEELCQSDHQVLGHLPDQGPSPVALFGWAASSRVSLGINLVPPFKYDGVFLGTVNAAELFCYPSPDLCRDTILSWSSTDNSFDFMAWFLL